MIRQTQAIVSVMACTIASGVAGGVVGATISRLAPSFALWLASHGGMFAAGPIDPTEFGFGLGTVSGLFLGTATGAFLVVALAFRDAWLVRSGVRLPSEERETVLDRGLTQGPGSEVDRRSGSVHQAVG
jgi:hypothetical protein